MRVRRQQKGKVYSMEVTIKDLATGGIIGKFDGIPEIELTPQCEEVIGGIDLATGSSFTAEIKVDLSLLNALCLFPNCIFTNNFLKYHGRPMLRRKHLRRERYVI